MSEGRASPVEGTASANVLSTLEDQEGSQGSWRWGGCKQQREGSGEGQRGIWDLAERVMRSRRRVLS